MVTTISQQLQPSAQLLQFSKSHRKLAFRAGNHKLKQRPSQLAKAWQMFSQQCFISSLVLQLWSLLNPWLTKPFNLHSGPLIVTATRCRSASISNHSFRKHQYQHQRHLQSKKRQARFLKSIKLRYQLNISHKSRQWLSHSSAKDTSNLRSLEIRTKSLHIWSLTRRIKLLRRNRLPPLARTPLNNTLNLILIDSYNAKSVHWTQSYTVKLMNLKRNRSHQEAQLHSVAST